MSAFEQLHPDLRHHIVNSLGWSSLREVQRMAIPPIQDGANSVLLAPTAGGKTEAAFFPLISQMLEDDWQGLSILYLSPIKALLNNQFDRLERLLGLVGRTVGVWHGDIAESKKKRMRTEPPQLLLTTPESLEGMLISTRTDRERMFGDLRAVVIDEIHAFAGDDRGWHLLGVLQRLADYAGRDIQRLGLSATVGNPDEIARWLGRGSSRDSATIDPPRGADASPEVTLDWVGNLQNAAKVLSMLHKGERRLVFCDSRLQTEKLARELRARKVETHLTHSSLSADERRRTERAFAEGGPGVIVATSALELGIDIGSLDRVIQIDAPYSVASFLQRMGRTGRRAGTTSNMLMLATKDWGLVRGAAILDMWENGEIEPARAPSQPHHILAQQLMALLLEQPGISVNELLRAIPPFRDAVDISYDDLRELLQHLIAQGYLFSDGSRLGIGRAGEESFGRRNFLELVSVFTTPPVFQVKYQRRELGQVHQSTFLTGDGSDGEDTGPITILLAGRSWRVTDINWNRRVAHVEPYDVPGKSRWVSAGQPMTPALAAAHHRVLTDTNTATQHWSKRASNAIATRREDFAFLAVDRPTVLETANQLELWTFAGGQPNQFLARCLEQRGVDVGATSGLRIVIEFPADLDHVLDTIESIADGDITPPLDEDHPMLRDLKFSELLPPSILQKTGRARIFGDQPAQKVPRQFAIVRPYRD